METPTYYELKSIEKDGLPKVKGEYFMFYNSEQHPNARFQDSIEIDPNNEDDVEYMEEHCLGYLSPIPLPEKRKTAEEILSEELIKASGMDFKSLYLLAHSNTTPDQKKEMEQMRELLKIVHRAMDIHASPFLPSSPKPSAVDIFEKHIGINAEHGYKPITKEDVIACINEALSSPSENNSKEEAIGFKRWTDINGWIIKSTDKEENIFVKELHDIENTVFEKTFNQLYELYSQAKDKK